MQIHLKLFAILREKTGTPMMDLELPAGATVTVAIKKLLEIHPEIEGLAKRLAFAVNLDEAEATTVLHDNDELALIPPVSGGAGA